MPLQPLIVRSRNGFAECTHFGAIAVVDTQGQLLAHAGNPHYTTFTRSTLKALQALPFMQAGGPRHFGFTQPQIAMLCASHGGEDMHAQAAEDMLSKAGQTYQVLRCGCHLPTHFDATGRTPPPDLAFDERHHNCSGKHSGFIAYCVQHGLDLATYIDPAHPLQQAVRQAVAQAVDMRPEDMPMGIDGCSAPNYAMPLSRLALGYARLAAADEKATPFAASFAQLRDAMVAHPDMVSGTGRNDLAFMQAGGGDWVSKVGADGVQVIASRERGEAIAIKIADGDKPSLFAATVEAMAQRGWLDNAQQQTLAPWRAAVLRNVRGLTVGARAPVFQLTTKTP